MPKVIAKKRDWLKLGYLLFSQEGVKGIVVEKMAKKLNCNKSSFYWHFKSKEAFINDLIDYWVKTETTQIIDAVEKEKTSRQKYNRFVDLVFQHDPYLEFIFYLKRYARRHKPVQKLIDEIDTKRLAFTTNIFQELGYGKKEAQRISSIFYKYLIGYHEMHRFKKPSAQDVKKVKKELAYILNVKS